MKTKLASLVDRFGDDLLKIDGFDDCLVGVMVRFSGDPVLLYDREKVIRKLSRDMTRDEAEEYFEFNIIGAWLGDKTPAFLIR